MSKKTPEIAPLTDTRIARMKKALNDHLLPEAKVVLLAMILTEQTRISTLALGELINAPMSEIGEAWISLKTAGLNVSKSTDWVEIKAGE